MIISCKDNNLFIILSASGLAASFRITIHYQYGFNPAPDADQRNDAALYFLRSSSIIATAVGMGMLLAITRKTFMRRIKMTSKHKSKQKPLIISHRRRYRRTCLSCRSSGRRTYPPQISADAGHRSAPDATITRGRLGEIPNHAVWAGALMGKSKWFKIKSLFKTAVGVLQSMWIILKNRPACVVGFGGYASFPAPWQLFCSAPI